HVSAPTHISPLSLHDALPISHNNLVRDLLTAKNFSGNALKNGGLLRIYGRSPPVENLCTTCATPPRSSHIFRLLCTYQSETIPRDRKSTRLNSSHLGISYAVF